MPDSLRAGVALLALLVLAVVCADLVAPFDPLEQNPTVRLSPPSMEHPLGTDAFGRDILSRVLYGGRFTLTASFAALSAALCLGVCAGMAAGILGGLCDAVLMRIVDVLMAFPFTVLALVVTALFGTGFLHLLFAVAAVWWVPFARLARSITLSSGNDIEVAAARVLGASGLTIAVHEILPKVTGPAWVLATFELGKLILSLSALSFFGLGAKPPSPEWGTMLADAKVHFFRAPHLLLGPALFIFLTVLSLNLMGEGLRDRLDPFEIPGF